MKSLTSYVYFTAALLLTRCLSADEDTEVAYETCSPRVHSQMIYLKHREGKGIGYKDGYSSAGAFLVPYRSFSDILPFADLRGHVFNSGKFAANAGVGLKYLTNCPIVLGAAGYYDWRQSPKHQYHQASLSLEALGLRWEARVNGYLPFGQKKHKKTKSHIDSYNFDHFAGHNLFYSVTSSGTKKSEFAMKGADAELGGHLIEPLEDYTLYFGAGPYYFDAHTDRKAWGGKARLEARITPYLIAEISDSYDKIFHNRFQGQLSFNIPFGGRIKKKNAKFNTTCSNVIAIEARMIQPMVRHEIIVVDKRKRHFTKTEDPIAIAPSGSAVNIQFVNNTSGGGDGTFENPFNTLAAAQAASTFGDIIYVAPGDGTATGMNSGITLIADQSLLGLSTPQNIPILVNNKVISLLVPALTSGLPQITNTGANVVTLKEGNTTVSGFNITAPGGFNGIYATVSTFSNSIANLILLNNNITLGAGSQGISLTSIGGTNVIANNTISGGDVSAQGIFIDEEGLLEATVTLQNNTVTHCANDGIDIFVNTGGAGSAQVTAFLFSNTANFNAGSDAGIFLASDNSGVLIATLTNNITNNNTNNGIELFTGKNGLLIATLDNNTSSTNGALGIELSPGGHSSLEATINLNTLTNNSTGIGGGGSFTTDGMVSAIITNNTILDNLSGGIIFDTGTSSTHLTIEGNTLINNAASSVSITNENNTCLKLSNNNNSNSYKLTNSSGSFLVEPLDDDLSNILITGTFTHVPLNTCAP